ncbi:MAG: DUF169 domain-containing protein [Methanomicrobiales archaeon]|jgi:uncharacterized protein (DUF169 family)|nr:DUF169 domain-containing protein [Methanomicrobiales archaeon]
MSSKDQYAHYSSILREFLHLGGSPVAIGFAHDAKDIPEGFEELSENMRHCQMVGLARDEERSFFARREVHSCAGGAWSLGLAPLTKSLESGEFYFKLGKFESASSCKRTIANVPALASGSVHATMYAPLGSAPFAPAVVVLTAEPAFMLKLAQAYLFKFGGRIESSFAGIQSVCADAATFPYMSGKVNISLGCDGSRKFSSIAKEYMVAGMPFEVVSEIVAALPVVCGAPGSSTPL